MTDQWKSKEREREQYIELKPLICYQRINLSMICTDNLEPIPNRNTGTSEKQNKTKLQGFILF